MARYDEEELISRATRAYCTRQRRSGESYDQPSASSSHAEDHDGRVFIVLESIKGILAVYRLKDDGHIEYVQEEYWPAGLLEEYKVVHPGLDGTYEGTCIACLTPTDTALAFRGEAKWFIAGLYALGIPEDQAFATAHVIWSESDPMLRKGQVPGGIVTEAIRVCRKCVRSAGPSFPDPVLAIADAEIPVISQYPETYLRPA